LNPIGQILLKIDKSLQDEIITDSGIKFYLDPSFNKEWQATVTATIAALPVKYANKYANIISQLKVGDEVCISYRVVADFAFKGDGHRCMAATEDNPHKQEFINGKGERILKAAMPKRSGFAGIMWVGTLTNKFGDYIDGVQGDESAVDRWMAQFPFGQTDDYAFNNYISYKGEEYWKCNISDVFAKKVNGKLVAIGDRVIGRYVEEEVPEDVKRSLMYNGDMKIRYQDRLRVLTGGEDLGLKENNTINFITGHLEKYSFYGKEYYMIRKKSINGVWSNN